jgi:hypothetical protein
LSWHGVTGSRAIAHSDTSKTGTVLNATGLAKSYGERTLFASVDLTDYSNPNGKTTTMIAQIDPATMTEAAVDSAKIQKWYAAVSDEGMMMISAPFQPDLLWGIAPSGNIIVANSDDYVIKIYSPALELLKETQHETKKPKVTKEDEDDYLSDWKDDDAKLMARKRARFPKYKPHFDALIIDHEGYLIILTGGTDGDLSIYDVFSPDGEFVNSVKMPRVRASAIFTDGVVYNIERHDDEADPTVHRYRVR